MRKNGSTKEVEKGEPKSGEVVPIHQPGEQIVMDLSDLNVHLRFIVHSSEVQGGKLMLWMQPDERHLYLLPASLALGRYVYDGGAEEAAAS